MMQYQNPYVTNPYVTTLPYLQQSYLQQPVQQTPTMQQQVGTSIRVSGRDEAMNRFIMMTPANMLVPGFVSDALFDVDGKHFHALSIEADGSRNLQTFSYDLDDQSTGTKDNDYVTHEELNALLGKMMGGKDGMAGSVQEAGTD